jgi:hypothetical protein
MVSPAKKKKENKNIPPPFSFIFLEAIGAPPLARNIFYFLLFSFLFWVR